MVDSLGRLVAWESKPNICYTVISLLPVRETHPFSDIIVVNTVFCLSIARLVGWIALTTKLPTTIRIAGLT